MSIQGNINQLLTLAAVGAKLDPRSELRAEKVSTEKAIKNIETRQELLMQEVEEGGSPERANEEWGALQEQRLGLTSRLTELDPSSEALRRQRKAELGTKKGQWTTPAYESKEEMLAEMAMEQREAVERLETQRLARTKVPAKKIWKVK